MILDSHLSSCPICRARLKREAGLLAIRQRSMPDAAPLPHGATVYTCIASPFGTLWLAASEHGLLYVTYGEDELTFCERLESLSHSIPIYRPQALAATTEQFSAYFAGTRRQFELSLDLRSTGEFRRAVLEITRRIPYGETWSYGEVAAEAGYPGAARAVGTTMATCQLSIVVPCHRVVRSDGQPGQYGHRSLGGCGIEYKHALLAWEKRNRPGDRFSLR